MRTRDAPVASVALSGIKIHVVSECSTDLREDPRFTIFRSDGRVFSKGSVGAGKRHVSADSRYG